MSRLMVYAQATLPQTCELSLISRFLEQTWVLSRDTVPAGPQISGIGALGVKQLENILIFWTRQLDYLSANWFPFLGTSGSWRTKRGSGRSRSEFRPAGGATPEILRDPSFFSRVAQVNTSVESSCLWMV